MKPLSHIGCAALCLALSTGAALAQRVGEVRRDNGYWVQERTGILPAAPNLRVSALGEISVAGRAGSGYGYSIVLKTKARSAEEAARLFDEAELTAIRRGPTATVALEDPACWRCGFHAEVRVDAPLETYQTVVRSRGGSIRVRSVSGNVTAESDGGVITLDVIGGDVRAVTAGGSITLGEIGGDVTCETAGGSIRLDRSRGDATLHTSGGAITVGEVGGRLRAETAGGGISAEKVARGVIAGTAGGGIEIGEAGGLVHAETAGGRIEIANAPGGVRAEAASGGIRLERVAGRIYAASLSGDIQAAFLAGRRLEDSLLEATSGNIVIYLPADLRVAIDAVVDFAHGRNTISSEFSGIRVIQTGDEFGPGEVRATGDLNGGGPVLRLRNTSGRIQIRRLQQE